MNCNFRLLVCAEFEGRAAVLASITIDVLCVVVAAATIEALRLRRYEKSAEFGKECGASW